MRPYHGDPEAFPCAVSFCLCEVVACTLSCPRNGAVNSRPAVLPVAPRRFRKKKRRRDGEMLASYARAPASAACTNARIGNCVRSLSGCVGVRPPDFGGSLQRILRNPSLEWGECRCRPCQKGLLWLPTINSSLPHHCRSPNPRKRLAELSSIRQARA